MLKCNREKMQIVESRDLSWFFEWIVVNVQRREFKRMYICVCMYDCVESDMNSLERKCDLLLS